MALTDKLTSIANAIREKGGTTEKLTLDAMPTAIAALPTGGGEEGVPETINFSGSLEQVFSNNKWDWVLTNYSDRIKTKDITTIYRAFENTVINPPYTLDFDINAAAEGVMGSSAFKNSNIIFKDNAFDNLAFSSLSEAFKDYKGEKIPPITLLSTASSLSGMFENCYDVKEIGDITNFTPTSNGFQYLFGNCYNLREMPKFINADFSKYNAATYTYGYSVFQRCYSLREIDEDFLKKFYDSRANSSQNYMGSTFQHCASLNKIVGFYPSPATLTQNQLNYTFNHCYRLNKLTFLKQEDNTPFIRNWKGQTLSLNTYVGWAGASNAEKYILNYNSGITADKEVVSQADYERLKDDPDWWSRQFSFSRFGHNAAVELIDSLPDTSAYLAANGGTNTVKFYSNAGNAIDGGSVNALTEEEIAVATAKGWTISYTTA